jgi:hypothetical protein
LPVEAELIWTGVPDCCSNTVANSRVVDKKLLATATATGSFAANNGAAAAKLTSIKVARMFVRQGMW